MMPQEYAEKRNILHTPPPCSIIELMKTLEQRINNVIGQLEAIKTMIKTDEDCFKALTQMKAAKAGLNKTMQLFLEEHAMGCISETANPETITKLKVLVVELSKE